MPNNFIQSNFIQSKQILICLITIVTFLNVTSNALAQEDRLYCQERKLGHYFYCEKPKPAVKEKKPEPPLEEVIKEPEIKPLTARERIAEIRAQLQEMRSQAILEPTAINVAAYIRYQREQLDRASLFTDVWQRVLWQHPELDYTLERPVGTIAKKVWANERAAEQKDLLANLGERYGLFYIYSGSCSVCRAFSPLLRAFADRYGLSIKAISTDGSSNDYFPNATADKGQVSALLLGHQPVPAVILFDAKTREVIPVGFGLMTEEDLKKRIYLLILKGVGDDY